MTKDLGLCLAYVEAHPGDAARVFERLPAADVAALLETMAPRISALVFDQMSPAAAADCLGSMRPPPAAAILAELRTDLAASILRRLEDGVQDGILAAVPEPDAGFLRTVLRYQEGTAGALMDSRVMAVAEDVAAGEALTRLRRSPRHMLFYLYIVDRTRRLAGVVDVRELMLARPGEPLAGVMHRAVARLTATMTPAAILGHPGWRQFHALPVVDDEARLVGAIRYQTFRRLEEAAGNRAGGADAVAAVFALGELYWLGLSGLLEGLASAVKQVRPRADGVVEGHHGTA